jgi:hypothetical protein
LRLRSRLEQTFATILEDNKIPYEYEAVKIAYTIPESEHVYTVDWSFPNKPILIESKGYLSDYKERHKYVLLKEQHPDMDLRFVFDNPKKLCGGTKMTHGAWAEKYNFPYCSIKEVHTIKEWLSEKEKA